MAELFHYKSLSYYYTIKIINNKKLNYYYNSAVINNVLRWSCSTVAGTYLFKAKREGAAIKSKSQTSKKSKSLKKYMIMEKS